MIMKVLTILALASFLLPSIAPAGDEGDKKTYKIRWVLAHEPVDVFARAAKHFSEYLAKKSGGAISVEVIDSRSINEGQVYSPNKVAELLSRGEIEMSQTYTTDLGTRDPNFWALDLPFLFKDHKHAEQVLEGKVGQRLLAKLEPSNMKGLAFTYSGGYRVIPTNAREIKRLEDMKGLKIRVPLSSPVAISTFKTVGAFPVPLAHDVGVSKVSDGVIDGAEITLVRYWDAGDQEVQRVVNDTGHSLLLTAMIMNKDFFDSLPKRYQEMVGKAALHAARMEREDSIRDGEKVKGQLGSNNIKYVKMSQKEVGRFRKATQSIYEDYKNMFDQGLIEELRGL
jgi:TRAP-type transport system periplasmic protein